MTLTRVVLTRGHRPSAISNGGGAIRITDAHVVINDSEISENHGLAVNGAGIYIEDGVLEVNNSLFYRNTLDFGESPFQNHGAGLYAEDSVVSINDSRFYRNLYLYSEPAGSSMYLKNSSLNLRRSLIDEEHDGLLADQSDVHIENTTFSKSPIHQSGYSRDLVRVRDNSTLRMNHVTFGAYGFVATDSTIDVTNSILRRCFDSTSIWLQDSNNLRLDDECNGDMDSGIYMEGLGDNGGPTKTHALGFQSQAINTGHSAHCLSVDQRGETRGTACDIGAYEVNDIADVAVDLQVVTPTPWGTSQTIQVNLTLTNNGPGLASLFNLNAVISGLTITDIDSFACPDLPCVYPFVSAGSQVVIPIHARLSSLVDTEFELAVEAVETVNSLHHDPILDNNEDRISGTVVAAADLELVKTLITSPPFFVGQSIQYEIDVNHVNGLTATEVQVTEQPENLTITSMTGCNSVSGLVCTINAVSANFPGHITVTATIDAAFFNNVASVSASEFDPDSSNNIDDLFNGGAVSTADLSVEMVLLTNGPHYSDQFVQYEVTIRAGSDPATNLVLSSEYPGIYIGVSGCGFLPCEFPTIVANGEITLVFSMFAPLMYPGISEEVTHAVYLSAGQSDPDLTDNTASITTTLVPAVDIQTSLNLISEPPYYVGQEIDYSLQVKNRGLNHAEDVVITLSAMENLALVWAASQNCTALNCVVPFLDFDQTEDFVIKMKVLDVGDFDLSAKAVTNDFDPLSNNNVDETNNGGVASELPNDLIFQDDFEQD